MEVEVFRNGTVNALRRGDLRLGEVRMTGPSADGRVRFDVPGVPVPQGSARAFVVNGHAVVTSANRNLKGWRQLVNEVARAAAPKKPWAGPVAVHLGFRLPLPPSRRTTVGRGREKRKLRVWPDRRPDLDKLVRGVVDGMTSVVFVDDSQVVELHARKDYGLPGVRVLAVRLLPSRSSRPSGAASQRSRGTKTDEVASAHFTPDAGTRPALREPTTPTSRSTPERAEGSEETCPKATEAKPETRTND
jgi:crossover junction endodeoxyribonuclease RusA